MLRQQTIISGNPKKSEKVPTITRALALLWSECDLPSPHSHPREHSTHHELGCKGGWHGSISTMPGRECSREPKSTHLTLPSLPASPKLAWGQSVPQPPCGGAHPARKRWGSHTVVPSFSTSWLSSSAIRTQHGVASAPSQVILGYDHLFQVTGRE